EGAAFAVAAAGGLGLAPGGLSVDDTEGGGFVPRRIGDRGQGLLGTGDDVLCVDHGTGGAFRVVSVPGRRFRFDTVALAVVFRQCHEAGRA
ncbi:hypothetical protein, partial [Ameyamaea chiangmaiensis]